MAKKITAVLLVLVLGLSVLFCGCSTDTVLNALSIDTDTYDPATEMVASVLEELKEFNSTMGLDSMVEYFYDDVVSFLDYFPEGTDIFIDDRNG